MITDIQLVTIPVLDQDKALDFYVNTLGCKVLADVQNGPFRWLQVAPEGAQTSLVLYQEDDRFKAGTADGLVLTTDDCDADVKALQAKGLQFDDISDNPWSKVATFHDPFGNGLSIQQMLQN